SSNQVLYYRINGVDDCGNTSEMSAEARLGCAFSGDVEIVSPTTGTVSAQTPVTVAVRSPQGTYAGVAITYKLNGVDIGWRYDSATSGTSWTDNGWTGRPAGRYTITATVTNDAGCTDTEVMDVVSTIP